MFLDEKILRIVASALYSPNELASYLGIQPRTLETWRRKQLHPELKFQRVGRRIRYRGRDILTFLNQGARPKRKRGGAR
jgi:Helix-turn-helix domain